MNAKQARFEKLLSRAGDQLRAGRATAAVAACRRALAIEPSHPGALKLAALAAYQAGDRAAARTFLEATTGHHPNDPEAHYNLGVLRQAGGDLEGALESFGRAAALSPGAAEAHYNYATTLNEIGRPEAAIDAYNRAITADPGYAPAHASLAFVLRGQSRFDDAVAAYQQAIALAPDDAQAHSGLGETLQSLGRLDEARAAYEAAIACNPDYPEARSNLADVLIEAGDPAGAVGACDRYLARRPADAGVLASKTIALNECNDREAVRALVDFDRLLGPTRFEPPQGFDSLAALNAALAAHVQAHPTLVVAPASNATRFGKHTGELLGDPAPPIAAFESMIRDAVQRYQERLGNDSSHPFLAHAPARWRLTAWSIVLEGCGYQAPHIHPSAWLSGVYYVQLPDVVDGGDPARPGWIEFGRPGEEYHWKADPELRMIRPEPGLMMLFPSYFFHRTIPFESRDTRISIAFDVIPEL